MLDDHPTADLADDRELVAGVVGGDDAALNALYRRYVRPVYAMVLRMLGDEEGTEEVVQDVFVRVWRRAAAFDASRATFPTWVLGIAHNLAVDELRRRRARPMPFEPPTEGERAEKDEPRATERAGDPESMAGAADVGVAVRAALAGLPGAQRAAIELAYFGGLSQSEIAAATAVPLGTIKSRIRYGMLALQDALGGRGYGPPEMGRIDG